jgi:hypothetical protein
MKNISLFYKQLKKNKYQFETDANKALAFDVTFEQDQNASKTKLFWTIFWSFRRFISQLESCSMSVKYR